VNVLHINCVVGCGYAAFHAQPRVMICFPYHQTNLFFVLSLPTPNSFYFFQPSHHFPFTCTTLLYKYFTFNLHFQYHITSNKYLTHYNIKFHSILLLYQFINIFNDLFKICIPSLSNFYGFNCICWQF
jgi:hypothetical protein